MADSGSTPMEVAPAQQAEFTDNSTEASSIVKTNPDSDDNQQKFNNKRKGVPRNRTRARVAYLRKRYLMKRNRNNLPSQQKDQPPLKPSDSKVATLQSKRRRTFIKKIHLEKNGIDISFDMSESEQEMLQFYIVKLSVLKSENESLHSQLERLAKENMKLLQKKPVVIRP